LKKYFLDKSIKLEEESNGLKPLEDLLEIKIRTSEEKLEIFKIGKECLDKPYLFKISLYEFMEKAKINKELYLPIVAKIIESVFSLNKFLEKKISKSFLEDFIQNKQINDNKLNLEKEEYGIQEMIDNNIFKNENEREKFDQINEKNDYFSNEENERNCRDKDKLSYLHYRTSISTCQSEDEEENYDLLLNKTL